MQLAFKTGSTAPTHYYQHRMTDVHVLNGPTEGVCGGVSVNGLLAQTKVGQNNMALSVQHYVFWLQVPGKGKKEGKDVRHFVEWMGITWYDCALHL